MALIIKFFKLLYWIVVNLILPIISFVFRLLVKTAALCKALIAFPFGFVGYHNIPFVRGLFLIFFYELGLLAPFRAALVGLYYLFGKPSTEFWAVFVVNSGAASRDYFIGMFGVFFIFAWIFLDTLWRKKQLAVLKGLPTSKVQALALGAVELKGKAISLDENSKIMEMTTSFFERRQWLRAFYLEDETGKVLVNPEGSQIREGWIKDILLTLTGYNEIVLSRWVDKTFLNVRRTLFSGDRVYLLGNAEVNPDAPSGASGPDRLVVKFSRQASLVDSFKRIFLRKSLPGRDFNNVFFISDSDEARAEGYIRKGISQIRLASAIWFVLSLYLLWSTYQLDRYESWRIKFWPNHYATDPQLSAERIRRFDSYLYKGMPQRDFTYFIRILTSNIMGFPVYRIQYKPEVVTGLIEGMQYKNEYIRDESVRAFVINAALEEPGALDAIPVLNNLLIEGKCPDEIISDIMLSFRNLRQPQTIEYMKKYLRHPDKDVRYNAATAIGEIADDSRHLIPGIYDYVQKEVMPVIFEMLYDKQYDTQALMVLCLYPEMAKPVTPTLINILNTDEYLAVWAANILVQLGPGEAKAAVPFLNRMAQSQDSQMRMYAQQNLDIVKKYQLP
ncbi:MAG: hypothetical protein A2297_04540 [Elusimicrobia bacterium RIFOXYB2_FULL_48_7]|nr:MAG: hypothetical protein A2297_04540 [Elusimicrobia bacterium RIFOXYB2_FULL_48_7]